MLHISRFFICGKGNVSMFTIPFLLGTTLGIVNLQG